MLTEKEVKFLNYLFKRVKGEHIDYVKLKKFIKKNFKLNDKDSFELAYLYDENFRPEGFSTDQAKIKRMSFDDYMGNIPDEIKLVMQITGDKDPEKYEFVFPLYGVDDKIIYNKTEDQEGEEYRLFHHWYNLRNEVLDNHMDYICEDSDDDIIIHYCHMNETDVEEFVHHWTEMQVDMLTGYEIMKKMGLNDETEAEEKYKKELFDDMIREMGDEPIRYLLANRFFNNIHSMISANIVYFDCDQMKKDYLDGMDMQTIVEIMGYHKYKEFGNIYILYDSDRW